MHAKTNVNPSRRSAVTWNGEITSVLSGTTVSLSARLLVLCVCVCVMLLLSSCALTHESAHFSKSIHNMQLNVYGSWVWLTLEKTDPKHKNDSFGGELIAVSSESLYVAVPALRVLSRKDIFEVRIVEYDSYAEGVIGLTILGNLSTISNGFFGLLTGPMWIIGGTITAVAQSYKPVFDYTGESCGDIAPFARFPAGLPGGMDRSTIKMGNDKRPMHFF